MLWDMATEYTLTDDEKAYVKLLENPYASLNFQEFDLFNSSSNEQFYTFPASVLLPTSTRQDSISLDG